MANWIQGAIKHPGALHRALHVKAGKPIPASKLKVTKGMSTLTKRRVNLAKTLRKLHK